MSAAEQLWHRRRWGREAKQAIPALTEMLKDLSGNVRSYATLRIKSA